MAIAPLPSILKSFTFDGESSADYGVQILGEGVFNVPERAVELVTVPGRNGAVAIDQGYWENALVTYPATLIASSPEEFAQAMSDFRNMLCSRRGYCRLSDDYHPDEYRLAMFVNDIEVDEKVLMTGEFDITFNCKPQRWLANGETPVTVSSGDTLTNPTPYDAGPLLAVKGYGTIGFNGYTVELNNEVVGELELVEGQSDTGSVNETYASGLMDSGDTITLVNPTLAFRASSKYSGAQAQTIKNISVSGASDVTTSEVVVSDQRRIMNITFNGVTFSAHQAGTYTQTFTISVVWAYGSGGSNHTVTYNVTVTFNNEVVDATHDRLTMRSTSTASSSDINYNRKLTFSALVGDSTQSVLGDPTYIDCEIGEAYKLDGDTVIGLNKYIELGSDLPTLASGANEVTYNGAITELKITPNWWKL